MKITHLSFLVLFLTLSSCYTFSKPEKPENLISEEKMVNVLVDMAIMSASKGVNKKKLEDSGIVPAEYIYKRNNIDSITFAESNAYYAFDIQTYNGIYKRVKDSLFVIREKYRVVDKKEKEERAEKKSKGKVNNREKHSQEDLDKLKNNSELQDGKAGKIEPEIKD
ncbi:DUF4296 domain-containing protein [uncultured Lacinutrix sp.]|uniref:DUF4296 domain-containing protein n=1 Tax=uncultured Lacinutrix sp. TaxID=574032 RepID=UPI00263A1312|nr:DUF4296 domain-containing protein [uncultured Lacinutrix sp.]